MPGMDGVALTEVIYSIYPATLVIWMTSYAGREDEAQRLSVYRYLVKHLNIDEIRAIVCEALEDLPGDAPSSSSDPPVG